MIDLNRVTLISIDTTDRIEETIQAVYTSMNGISYGSVKIITKDTVYIFEFYPSKL
jgi:hypothetical protein